MKKLLLILLCLPMIGFGQNHKIIFSSGDTIIGKVIEVGVNDITYQHKGETTNNVIKKRELAKVIYSSGRIETFKGLSILKSKFKAEDKKKIRVQKKKQGELVKKNYKKSLDLGFITGLTSSNYHGEYKEIELDGGIGIKSLYSSNIGISLKYNISNLISLNTNLMYQRKGAKYNFGKFIQNDEVGAQVGEFEVKSKIKDYYITLPIITKFNFNDYFSLNAGIYSSYLIRKVTETTSQGGIDTVYINQGKLDIDDSFDFGLILGSGFSYALNNKIRFTFDANLEYGLRNFNDFKSRYNIAYVFQLGCSYRLKQ